MCNDYAAFRMFQGHDRFSSFQEQVWSLLSVWPRSTISGRQDMPHRPRHDKSQFLGTKMLCLFIYALRCLHKRNGQAAPASSTHTSRPICLKRWVIGPNEFLDLTFVTKPVSNAWWQSRHHIPRSHDAEGLEKKKTNSFVSLCWKNKSTACHGDMLPSPEAPMHCRRCETLYCLSWGSHRQYPFIIPIPTCSWSSESVDHQRPIKTKGPFEVSKSALVSAACRSGLSGSSGAALRSSLSQFIYTFRIIKHALRMSSRRK